MKIVRNLTSLAVSLVVLCSLASSAIAERRRIPELKQSKAPAAMRHDTKFARVPDSKLQIRAVEYDGSTNGVLKVELKNTEKTAIAFSATGLYFVPDGDPDKAPQRLGAVGPMQLATNAQKDLMSIEVPAGQTVEVALDVFCIDSHRPSPSPANVFAIGTKRLPKELAQTIETRADAEVRKERAKGTSTPRPAAKSAIQSEVWKSRDAKWIKLDGEGTQEANK